MSKFLKKIRALPTDASSNDVLKVEYVEVNLNNSRKLISNISSASTVSTEAVAEAETLADDMLRLRNTRNELAWTDALIENNVGQGKS